MGSIPVEVRIFFPRLLCCVPSYRLASPLYSAHSRWRLLCSTKLLSPVLQWGAIKSAMNAALCHRAANFSPISNAERFMCQINSNSSFGSFTLNAAHGIIGVCNGPWRKGSSFSTRRLVKEKRTFFPSTRANKTPQGKVVKVKTCSCERRV